jgi:hypothetical protein
MAEALTLLGRKSVPAGNPAGRIRSGEKQEDDHPTTGAI